METMNYELEDRLEDAISVLMNKFDIDMEEARELALAEDEELSDYWEERDIEESNPKEVLEDTNILPGWRAYQFIQSVAKKLEAEGEDIEWGIVHTIGLNYKSRVEEGTLELSSVAKSRVERTMVLNSRRKLTGKRWDTEIEGRRRTHHEIPISFGEEGSDGSPDPVAIDIDKDTGEENLIPLPGDYDNAEAKMIAEEFLEDMQKLWEGGRGPKPEHDCTLVEAIELEQGDVPLREYHVVKRRLSRFRENHLAAFDLQEMLQDTKRR